MTAPVFIVSTGRCGSTLMSRLVNLHPRLLSVSEFLVCQGSRALVGDRLSGEELYERLHVPTMAALALYDETVKVSERLYEFGPEARYTRQDLPPILVTTLPHLTPHHEALWDELAPLVRARPEAALADQYRWLFSWLCERFGARTWVERSGGSILMVSQLAELFPEARFVHVYRDGRATALSMHRHDYFRMIAGGSAVLKKVGIDSQAPFNLPGVSPWMPTFEKVWFSLVDARRFRKRDIPLEVFGRFWSGMIERGLEALDALPTDRVLSMRYEDLVASPRAELERFIAFIDPGLSNRAWLDAAAAIPNAGSVGWARLSPEALGRLAEACEPGLSLLGYTVHGPEREAADAVWALSRVQLLSQLQRGQVEQLLRGSTLVTHEAGTLLVAEGDPGEEMFLIESGHVQVFHTLPDGEVVVVDKLGPGDHFGETALLLGGGRRTASVRCHSDVVLRCISHEALQAVLDDDDVLKGRMVQVSDGQLRRAIVRRSDLVRALRHAPVSIRGRDLEAGEVLVRRGDPPGDAFVVISGSLVVMDETRHPPVVRWRTGEGSCVGERSMLDGKPRSHTVVAETATRVLVIAGEDLRELVDSSPEWASHIQALSSMYSLPDKGYVTQFTGEADGADTLATLYHLPDGRRVMASRVVGRPVFSIDDLGTEVARRLEFRRGEERREVGLDRDDRVVSAVVQGTWPGLGVLVQRVLEREPVSSQVIERFGEVGQLEGQAAAGRTVVCSCLVVPEQRVRRCIADGARSVDAVQARLGCGSVCGGCLPRVVELLGDDQAWVPATLTEREELVPGVFRLALTPAPGTRAPAVAGMHIVVRGRVQTHLVQRTYTLTRASDPSAYEIGVKREEHGVFSRWLTDLEVGSEVEVSLPAGAVTLRDAMQDVVCLVGGIGVTPAVAIARAVAEGSLPRRVHVDLSASSPWQLPFAQELRALASGDARVTFRERVTSRDGRLTVDHLAELVDSHADADWFLCGPTGYLRDVQRGLEELGIPPERIHVEVFAPTGDRPGSLLAAPGRRRPGPPAADALDSGATGGWGPSSSVFLPARPPATTLAAAMGQQVLGGIARAGRTALGGVLWRTVGRPDARYDTRLPVDPTGLVGALAARFSPHVLETFRVLGARYPDTGHGPSPDPYTPDGNTFVLFAPSPSVVRDAPVPPSPKLPRIGATTAIHVLRGPATVRAVLEDPVRFDRQGYVHHYNQQGVGAAVEPPPGRAVAGLLFGPIADNATHAEDRSTILSSVTSSWLDRRAALLPEALRPVVEGLRARADAALGPFDAHQFTTRVAMRLDLAVFFGLERLDELEEAAVPIWTLSRSARELINQATRGLIDGEDVRRIRAPARGGLERIQAIVTELVAELPDHAVTPLMKAVAAEDDVEWLFPRILSPLLAGQEASGATWAWAVYVMTRQPDVRARLLDEVDRWKATHADAPVGLMAMNERPYTLAFLLELQRRYPAMQQVIRIAMCDGELPADPTTGIGAFSFSRGASLFTAISAINRCERWWPGPDRFDPERFFAEVHPDMPVGEQGRAVRSYARQLEESGRYLPFGRGPGTCVGRAMNQVNGFAFVDHVLGGVELPLVDPELQIDQVDVGPPTGAVAVTVRRR